MLDAGLIDMIMALRSRGISDNAVLRAMEMTPRRHFLHMDYHADAYEMREMPIACGQSLSDPFAVALMCQMLETEPGHKVLEIGTGSGYHAAVLSHLCKRVYSVERYKGLSIGAEAVLQRLARVNIVIRHGDGRYGWKGQAPFDRIIIGCAVKKIPDGLFDQLTDTGQLLAVTNDHLSRFTRKDGGMHKQVLFPLLLPMIERGKSKTL